MSNQGRLSVFPVVSQTMGAGEGVGGTGNVYGGGMCCFRFSLLSVVRLETIVKPLNVAPPCSVAGSTIREYLDSGCPRRTKRFPVGAVHAMGAGNAAAPSGGIIAATRGARKLFKPTDRRPRPRVARAKQCGATPATGTMGEVRFQKVANDGRSTAAALIPCPRRRHRYTSAATGDGRGEG